MPFDTPLVNYLLLVLFLQWQHQIPLLGEHKAGLPHQGHLMIVLPVISISPYCYW